MTERDVIAGVLGPHCGIDSDWCSCGWKQTAQQESEGYMWEHHVTDALIAAGVTMPALCGDRAGWGVRTADVHQCTDSVGRMFWRDTYDRRVDVGTWKPEEDDEWPIGEVTG